MKTLFLIRHAKSSWCIPELDDLERPLNDRGNIDAPRVAERMEKNWPSPEKILCSQALRARETAEIMSQLWWKKHTIEIEVELYGASASSSLEIINRVPDEVNSLALVFHNPTITHLSNLLAQLSIPNVPTCGIVILELRVDSWKKLKEGTCKLLDFEYPKRKIQPS